MTPEEAKQEMLNRIRTGTAHRISEDELLAWCRAIFGHKKLRCWDCDSLIEDNDDAQVCIQCGGRNRRKYR